MSDDTVNSAWFVTVVGAFVLGTVFGLVVTTTQAGNMVTTATDPYSVAEKRCIEQHGFDDYMMVDGKCSSVQEQYCNVLNAMNELDVERATPEEVAAFTDDLSVSQTRDVLQSFPDIIVFEWLDDEYSLMDSFNRAECDGKTVILHLPNGQMNYKLQ